MIRAHLCLAGGLCSVLLSHKYVSRASVREIRLKGKLQLYFAAELVSCCSQVMGHVCASPHPNLTAAAVCTVIRHKSQSKRWGGGGGLGRVGWRESEERDCWPQGRWRPRHSEAHCSLLNAPHSLLFLFLLFFFLPVKNTNTLLQFVTKASPPSCGCGSWTMLGALLVLWVHFKSSKQHTSRNNGCFHCWCGQMLLFLFPFSSEFKILFKMCHNYHHSTINKPLCMLWTTVVL